MDFHMSFNNFIISLHLRVQNLRSFSFFFFLSIYIADNVHFKLGGGVFAFIQCLFIKKILKKVVLFSFYVLLSSYSYLKKQN